MFIFFGRKTFQKRLILGYKHIRLKSSTATLHCPKEITKIRVNKLSEILDCSPLTAKQIVSKNNLILSLSSDCFIRNTKFCIKHLKFSDVIEFPVILSLESSLLQHRYFSLLELGCSNITASHILRFSQILKKTPFNLQKEGILFTADNFLDKYLKLLDRDNKDDLKVSLQKMYNDGCSLGKIKEAMNAEFLMSKFNCSYFRAHQLFKRYPPLRCQSIFHTNLLLDLLIQILHFSHNKIFKIPNLLSLHPEIVQNFLSKIPTILDINTIQIINQSPLLLRRDVDSVREIECVLRDFNISGKQLLCCPKIINFTPTTLRQRLETICGLEDFSLLKSYKKFLFLVYHYNNLNPRLKALKENGIPCSITMFTVTNSNFDKYLCVSQCRSYIKDICFYLAEVFDCSEREILLKLKEYPSPDNPSLSNCNKVVEYLLKTGITKEQLFNGLGVTFYDIEIVKMYFQEIQTLPECQPFAEWINHYNLVQLLIYKIEVDAGFRGLSLYKPSGKSEEFNEMSMAG